MEKLEELHPINLEEANVEITDILSGSDDIIGDYSEIGCTGIGAAACKESCISGCKDNPKSGTCQASCMEGCKDGCKAACLSGKK